MYHSLLKLQSPNGDGANDFFEVFKRPQHLDFFRVKVYDRIGELVFDNLDYINFSWDGTFKGKSLAPQVLVYVVEASAWGSDDVFKYKGSITLIR